MFLRRFVEYLKTRVTVTSVVSQSCSAFLEDVAKGVAIDGKTLRFCYDRLTSLIKTLEIHNTDDFWPLQLVADFGTLIGTYDKGFAVIIEPWDDRLPSVPDPVIQLACLDASLAMKPVFDKFQVCAHGGSHPCGGVCAGRGPAALGDRSRAAPHLGCVRMCG